MGQVSYMKQIPEGALLLDPIEQPWPRYAVISEAVWNGIDAYNGTLPTAPSAGRVYKREAMKGLAEHVGQGKFSGASGPGNVQDTLYVVLDAPPDDPRGGQCHYPFEALVVQP